MKTVTFLITLLYAAFVAANPIDDNCPSHVIYGAPVSSVPDIQSQYMCKTGYALHYVYSNKLSEYAVEHVTKASVVGSVPRKDEFREDPEVPVQHRATLKDYVGSGYDRGHMAPAADLAFSAQAMSESFFLSNMMPQAPGNNRGIWKYLETYVRTWADVYGEVFVITGTVLDKPTKQIGDGVTVPGRIYKIVYAPYNEKAIAFLFPNEKLPVDSMPKYIVTIEEIEKITGLKFLPNLPFRLQNIKKTKANWADWPG